MKRLFDSLLASLMVALCHAAQAQPRVEVLIVPESSGYRYHYSVVNDGDTPVSAIMFGISATASHRVPRGWETVDNREWGSFGFVSAQGLSNIAPGSSLGEFSFWSEFGPGTVECSLVGAGSITAVDAVMGPTGSTRAPSSMVMDGWLDAEYGQPLAVQGVQTQFGDSTAGNLATATGSELDNLFAYVADGQLHLFIGGNLESNHNKLEVFLDTVPGGQQRLRSDNPDVDFDGLNRMGGDGARTGLNFDAGFAADYYFTLSGGIERNGGYRLFVSAARLRSGSVAGVGEYLGSTEAVLGNGVLIGGSAQRGVAAAINNSNVRGVGGTGGTTTGAGVSTGVELIIPLSYVGSPHACNIKMCIFINGGRHDFVSNQVFGGLPDGSSNLGEPRSIDFAAIPGNQFIEVAVRPALTVAVQPATLVADCGQPIQLSLDTVLGSEFSYRWQARTQAGPWIDLFDGENAVLPAAELAGTGTSELTILQGEASHRPCMEFRCKVVDSCRLTLSATALVCNPTVPCSGLILHHAFDNCVTTDRSGLGNDLVVEGNPECVAGVVEDAFSFDGIDDACRIPNAPSLNPTEEITVVTWFMPRVPFGGGNNGIISKGAGPNFEEPFYQYQLALTGDFPGTDYSREFQWAVQTDNNGSTTGRLIHAIDTPQMFWAPGTWYLLVGRYDGAAMKFDIFDDHGPRFSASLPVVGRMHDSGQDVCIARYSNWSEPHVPGTVDEVRIYSRALSDAEVSLLYRSPSGRPLLSVDSTCLHGTTMITATRIPAACETFQWRKDDVALSDIPSKLVGTNTDTLTIFDLSSASDAGRYDLVVSTVCERVASNSVYLGSCYADFNEDGGIDGSDIDAFFAAWESGASTADTNCDGGVDGSDIGAFFSAWERGECE